MIASSFTFIKSSAINLFRRCKKPGRNGRYRMCSDRFGNGSCIEIEGSEEEERGKRYILTGIIVASYSGQDRGNGNGFIEPSSVDE